MSGIRLGLSRITKLLAFAGSPHEKLKVLHVAGTNGKGSVCSYLTTLLQDPSDSAVKIGKFTSPHLVDVRDSIMVNNTPISSQTFNNIKTKLTDLNKKHLLNCSEFELLTCIAFLYFHQVNCSWCVLEVGLGGRIDATNVIPGANKYACGITKIGLDHQGFLGNTMAEIAIEKVGIATPGAKYLVIDGTNDRSVLDVARKQCESIKCDLKITDDIVNHRIVKTKSWGDLKFDKLPLNGDYQIFNFRVALAMLDHLKQMNQISLTSQEIYQRLANTIWPGRLQNLDLYYAKDHKISVLLDGAHNGCAAIELMKYIRKTYGEQPLTFVIAVTCGKDLEPLFRPLIRPVDNVVTTKFSAVDGMPWIKANDPSDLATMIKEKYTTKATVQPDLLKVFPEYGNLKQLLRLNKAIQPRTAQHFREPTKRNNLKAGILPIGKQSIVGYLGLGLVVFGLWWQYYPHNPYPPSVSKYLRKASWEEIKTKDYKKSIDYYLDALKECESLGYASVDEKLTGIEIKIAEMYEQLDMKNEETEIYLKLLSRFYNKIKECSDLPIKRQLMKRDLSVLVKLIERSDVSSIVKRNLLQLHINLTQQQIETDTPEVSSMINDKERAILTNPTTAEYKSLMTKLKKYSGSFEQFREEFIRTRDLYSEICLSTNDIDTAIYSKMITIGWMVVSGMDYEKILMSQANLASLLYMKAESVEQHIYKLQKNSVMNDTPSIEKIMKLQKRYENILNNSEKYYESVLDKSKDNKIRFPPDGEQDGILLQARLLSMHGLAVIKLHKGDAKEAKKILIDTKRLAEQYGFDDIQNACENELQTIQRINLSNGAS
ncbi:folylpolyglutamate synthase [Maudiozyma exigua]|uniref:Folylpolyglutamate synthase n=1 Tax=Maudiozyma exigua TaxID=34358 RepID=A0A9P7B9Q0_MAUEX|nr:folylpolyglutamate synthase [Kazachstania exigua]